MSESAGKSTLARYQQQLVSNQKASTANPIPILRPEARPMTSANADPFGNDNKRGLSTNAYTAGVFLVVIPEGNLRFFLIPEGNLCSATAFLLLM